MTIPVHYHSKFGGLWTDRLDAEAELARRVDDGRIEPSERHLYQHFIENGYVILEGAVPHQTIDALLNDLENAWTNGGGRFLLDIYNEIRPLAPELRESRYKMLDLYVASASARATSFGAPIRKFLQNIFDEPPKAFQSLSFERGTEQAIHQDTAYVVVEQEPMKLAASWVALEDIQEGTGELEYYEKSHRIPDYSFGNPRKHWEPAEDGPEVQLQFLRYLHDEALKRGLRLAKFRPKKGDALIWSADLAHGGSAITNPGPTRRSLVTHYCPRSVSPHYMTLMSPERRWLEPFEGSYYCSMHYPSPHGTRGDVMNASRPSPARSLRKLRAALRKRILGPLKRRLRGL